MERITQNRIVKIALSTVLIMVICVVTCLLFFNPHRSFYKPHFMVNGEMYWLSSQPQSARPNHFVYFGDILEEVDSVTQDFQGYLIAPGSKIYLSPNLDCQAYLDNERYCTAEADRQFIRYGEDLYVSLNSADILDYEKGYYSGYSERFDAAFSAQDIPTDAAYLGMTHFEAYDIFPSEPLGSNSLGHLGDRYPVYQDPDDEYVLYVKYPDGNIGVYIRYIPVKIVASE